LNLYVSFHKFSKIIIRVIASLTQSNNKFILLSN